MAGAMAAASGGYSRWRERLVRFGHRSDRAFDIFMILLIAKPITKSQPMWVTVVEWVTVPLIVASIIPEMLHARSLCGLCLAEFPLDVQERAEKRHRVLRLFHLLSDRPSRVMFAFLAVVAVAVALNARVTIGQLSWSVGVWMIFGSIFTMGAIARIHSRLQAACPWCRHRGGGGDDDLVVAPPPSPHAVKR